MSTTAVRSDFPVDLVYYTYKILGHQCILCSAIIAELPLTTRGVCSAHVITTPAITTPLF